MDRLGTFPIAAHTLILTTLVLLDDIRPPLGKLGVHLHSVLRRGQVAGLAFLPLDSRKGEPTATSQLKSSLSNWR